jgi:hypothetical protein
MRRCIALALFLLGLGSVAEAEPVSIRCADEKAPNPYFATFDLDTKRVVFESPLRGFYVGEIRNTADDEIGFSIKGNYGKIDLVWERQNNRMFWAGLSTDPIRPFLVHRCATVDARTLLALYDGLTPNSGAGSRPFSLRCATDSNFLTAFFTMDRETKKVAALSLEGGSVYPGEIQTASEHRIEFFVGKDPKFDLVWDSHEGTVTWKGIPNESSRPTRVHQCKQVQAGSVLMLYERLAR